MAGALIITVELAATDFAWLEQLRRTHYPAERNQVPAHLTMFYALPPSAEREVRSALSRMASLARPKARIDGILDLGGGVAFRLVSSDLDHIRDELAGMFHGLLSAQDAGGWRPHITIQNKVSMKAAQALVASLDKGFRPRPLAIAGLGLYRYVDGPWEKIAVYPFRGA